MTTIFSFNNIEFLKQFKNLNYIKIASFDCNSHALIKKYVKNSKIKRLLYQLEQLMIEKLTQLTIFF